MVHAYHSVRMDSSEADSGKIGQTYGLNVASLLLTFRILPVGGSLLVPCSLPGPPCC